MAELQTVTLNVNTVNGPETVTGWQLGTSTSERGRHNHPEGWAQAGEQRCSACRWMEVAILFDDEAEQYVVVIQGRSAVPGEAQRCRVERTTSPLWVIETLQGPRGRQIPKTALRALTEAARFDADLADAYARRQDQVVR